MKTQNTIFCILPIVFCGLLLLSPFVFQGYEREVDIEHENKITGVGQPETAASPIYIQGEDEMVAFSPKTGSGTESDPYVIEGLTFDTLSSGRQLWLRDLVDLYVIIRDCTFNIPATAFSTNYGIVLWNCTNIVIQDCEFHCPLATDSELQVIYLNGYCGMCSIINNTFSNIRQEAGTTTYGIYLLSGSGEGTHLITGNRFTNISSTATMYCIWNSADSSNISSNHAYDIATRGSLYFFGAAGESNIVNENTVVGVQAGIDGGGDFHAFFIQSLDDSTIRDNVVRECSGAFLTTSLRALPGTIGNVISGNVFMAGTSPVEDFGTNQWYEARYYPVTGAVRYIGNHYWNVTNYNDTNGDYIADDPYPIYVTEDPYPLLAGALDLDQDGLLGYEELELKTDLLDEDTDGDGWTDYEEARVHGSNPLVRDSDGDGIMDPQDANPMSAEPSPDSDQDGDGLSDYSEVEVFGTDPRLQDSDGDGWSDYVEIKTHGTDPLSIDTDGDGLIDPQDPKPTDGGPDTTTDTDGDGLADYYEVTEFFTDPDKNDTDGDGWSDYDELKKYGTDPLSQDTDGDGIIDSQDAMPKSAPAANVPDYNTTILIVGILVGGGLIAMAMAMVFVSGQKTKRLTKGSSAGRKDAGLEPLSGISPNPKPEPSRPVTGKTTAKPAKSTTTKPGISKAFPKKR